MADNVEIRGLEFQIQENSTGAVEGLKNLKQALNGLKGVTNSGASGLSSTSKGLKEMKNALSGLNSGDVYQKLTRISTGLKTLKQVGNVKISSSIANQLNALNAALGNLRWTDGDKIQALANGLRPLSELGRANLTSFINQLKKFPEVIEQLEKVNIDKFIQQMKELAAAMKPFADEMQKVSSGFSAFPSRIQRLITSTEKYNSTIHTATSKTGLFSQALSGIKLTALLYVFRKLASFIGTAITKSNEYQENLNLFTVAMGEYADEAFAYGQTVSEALGIDLSDWIRNQGIFNTLLTGFGDTADRAALMSKNLTQLGYDLSSFFNISVEDAMQKLQSGISGELEPLRRLGYDLSQARLEATALSLGIDKSVNSMTQAEKAELRYYAIMTQVTTAQGDLARTLEAPANQLRILQSQFSMAARSIGNIFIPALNAILPYAIAVVQAIREIANAVASLFGFEITEVDYSGITSGAIGAGNMADSLEDAASAAKKLNQYTAGFDELHVISPETASGSGSIGAGAGGGFDFKLPEYDFLGEAVSTRVDNIKKSMEPFISWIKENIAEILETAAAIGTAMLQWRIAKGISDFFSLLKGLKGASLLYGIGFTISGLGLFLDGWSKIKDAISDIKENGPNLTNVTKLISGFAEGLSFAFMLLGNVKTGGAFLIISSVSGMISDISYMVKNGPDWESVFSLIRNLGLFFVGIGFITKNSKLAGSGLILAGVSLLVKNLQDVVEAFRTGDWSGVDKVELAAGLLMSVGGFLMAVGKVKTIVDGLGAGKAVTDTTTTMQKVSDAIGGGSGGSLNGTLKNLSKNLGFGLLVLVEVSAAAIVFIGTIAIIGAELDQAGKAWQPVIENGASVAAAIALGTTLLAGVGLAVYALGTISPTISTQIKTGALLLGEIAVVTDLFLAEIVIVGELLNKIYEAWLPIEGNKLTIVKYIGIGTLALAAVAAACWAIGQVSVMSAGTIPAAIGVGALVVGEISAAFVSFAESIVNVAYELNDRVKPAFDELNPKLPALTEQTSEFTSFMTDFSSELVAYTSSSTKASIAGAVDSFVKLFTGDPISRFADNLQTTSDDINNLTSNLPAINEDLALAVSLVDDYSSLLGELGDAIDEASSDDIGSSLDINFKEIGANLVSGLANGMDSKIPAVSNSVTSLKNTLTNGLGNVGTEIENKWKTSLDNMGAALDNFITGTLSKMAIFQLNLTNGMILFTTTFPSSWTAMWDGMSRTTVIHWNSILTAMEIGMNNAIDTVNRVISSINSSSDVTGIYLERIDRISIDSIPYMANGGFVNEGQLFVAREAGPELVGRFGNGTAVANNDMIVEGIAEGVYEAVRAAMADGNNNQTIENIMYLDGEVVWKNQQRVSRNRGYNFEMGAFTRA